MVKLPLKMEHAADFTVIFCYTWRNSVAKVMYKSVSTTEKQTHTSPKLDTELYYYTLCFACSGSLETMQ
jgi:hypothetical protein